MVNHLEGFGFTRKQAEGVTEALHKLDVSTLATKQDLEKVGSRLEARIDKLESRLEVKIAELKSELLKWMVTALLGQVAVFAGITVGLIKLMH